MPNKYLDVDLQHISDQHLIRSSLFERVQRWFMRLWHGFTDGHIYVPLHGINEDFIHQIGWICTDCGATEIS